MTNVRSERSNSTAGGCFITILYFRLLLTDTSRDSFTIARYLTLSSYQYNAQSLHSLSSVFHSCDLSHLNSRSTISYCAISYRAIWSYIYVLRFSVLSTIFCRHCEHARKVPYMDQTMCQLSGLCWKITHYDREFNTASLPSCKAFWLPRVALYLVHFFHTRGIVGIILMLLGHSSDSIAMTISQQPGHMLQQTQQHNAALTELHSWRCFKT